MSPTLGENKVVEVDFDVDVVVVAIVERGLEEEEETARCLSGAPGRIAGACCLGVAQTLHARWLGWLANVHTVQDQLVGALLWLVVVVVVLLVVLGIVISTESSLCHRKFIFGSAVLYCCTMLIDGWVVRVGKKETTDALADVSDARL